MEMNNRKKIKMILFRLFARAVTLEDSISELMLVNTADHIEFELEKLPYLRKQKNLTLRQVEDLTGISNAYLSQLENGKIKNPSYNVVVKLNALYTVKEE